MFRQTLPSLHVKNRPIIYLFYIAELHMREHYVLTARIIGQNFFTVSISSFCFFREFQSKIYQQIYSLTCRLQTFFQWVLPFCLFIGFYFKQLRQLGHLFYLFVVIFWPSKHSRHQFQVQNIKEQIYTICVFTYVLGKTL